MKKILYTLLVLMLAMVASDALAQKTVTYTFKGSILSGLNDSGTLYLKSSGAKPAGVPDPTKDDIHNYEKHLLGGLSTLYTIQENEYAWIDMQNFKYEIEEVKWRRRSQWNLATSKGGSWITTYDGKDVGYTAYEPEAGAEDAEAGDMPFSTSGELLYHDRTFATRAEVSPGVWENFAGLKKLNVQVTSTQVYKGIAVKEFDIKYYEPVPLIEYVESEVTENGNQIKKYTISVTIGFNQHIGAFTAEDLELRYDQDLLESVGAPDVTTSTDTYGKPIIIGQYTLKQKVDGGGTPKTGMTSVSAVVMNNGEVAGKSSTTLNLQVGKKKGFVQEGSNTWKDGSNVNSHKYNDTQTGTYTMSKVNGKTLCEFTCTSENARRMAVDKVSYNVTLPPYTKLERTVSLVGSADLEGGWFSANVSTNYSIEICNMGDNDFTDATFNSPTNATASSNSVARSRATSGTSAINSQPNPCTVEWDIDNNKAGTNDYQRFLALITGTGAGISSHQPEATVTYDDPANAFKYTYYSTVTFNANKPDGVEDSKVTGSTANLVADKSTKASKNEDSYVLTDANATIKDTETASTAGTALTANGFEIEGYTFVGWNTEPDGTGEPYEDKGLFSPYDADNACGKGPVTLYAQWVENAATTMIVTFYAEGGEIPASTIANAEYMHQVQVNAGHSDWATSLPTAPKTFKPTKVGCTFDGYYDQEGVKVFNADLTTIKADSKYFNADGTWKATDDVDFYAHFTENPSSVSEKWTINFNANGGSTSLTSVTVVRGGKVNNNVGTNPDTHESWIPTQTGKVFTGWYTATSGGTMVYNDGGVAIKLKTVHEENLDAVPPTPAWAEYEAYDNTRWTNDGKWNVAGTGTLPLYAQWKDAELVFDEKDATIEGGRTGHPTTYSDDEEMPKVIMKRALRDDKWNTICFPFNLNKTQSAYLFSEIKKFSELVDQGDELSMHFEDSEEIQAGVPYFVKINASATNNKRPAYFDSENENNLIAKDVVLEKTAGSITQTVNGKSVTMIGNFEVYRHITQGDLYLQKDEFFVSGATYDGKEIWGNNLGYRCTFSVSAAGLARLHIDLEGYDGWTGDGIEDVELSFDEIHGNANMYDLQGRRLTSKPTTGIYIMNGKKFIVK